MNAERLAPIDGDSNRWYISGRTGEMHGRLSLSAAEFNSLSHLFPMVAQFKKGRYECACVTSQDSRMAELTLAAIRMYIGCRRDEEALEGEGE